MSLNGRTGAEHGIQRRVVEAHARSVWLLGALAANLLIAQSAVPSAARAYEDKAGFALDLGYAHATQAALPHNGALVGVEASLGLDDIWTVRGAVSYSLHPGSPSLSVLMVGAELLYLIDVLEIVPYLGAGLDAIGSWAPGVANFTTEFGVHPVLGVDWLVGRNLVLGVQARPVFLISAWNSEPIYLSVSLNATWLLEL